MASCATAGCDNRVTGDRDFCGACITTHKLEDEEAEAVLVAYTDGGMAELEQYLRPRARFCDWLHDHHRP